MQRMTPTDHYTSLFETATSPMNIGALLIFDVPEGEKAGFAGRMRAHLERHVPRTVLARRLVASPGHYDADAWFALAASAALKQIDTPVFLEDLPEAGLRRYVTARGMRHLDLARAPFEIDILSRVSGPRCALYVKVHHGLMDGVGFQSLLRSLSDLGSADLVGEAAAVDEEVPAPDHWTALARDKFEQEEADKAAEAARKAAAQTRLADFIAAPEHQRRSAPEMAFGSEFSDQRHYRTLSFDLAAFRSVAKAFGASMNDLFLATAAGALRSYLLQRGQLPAAPLVSHSVRSTRREEHGPYGNRVLSIYPELATDEPDPGKRLRRIRDSMALEKARSAIEEDLVDLWDWPFGARDRRAACATMELLEAVLGSANVVLSNVPGAEERLTFAGYSLAANYPVPIVGPARFLNITSRRNADALDMGVMVDAAKIDDPDDLILHLVAAFRELAGIADATSGRTKAAPASRAELDAGELSY
ncbi:MAG: hypothetical protein JWQ97_2378 [Phenylobacterium sp.]|nr:hypothetical protein [Phenylobacterium sp.]